MKKNVYFFSKQMIANFIGKVNIIGSYYCITLKFSFYLPLVNLK